MESHIGNVEARTEASSVSASRNRHASFYHGSKDTAVFDLWQYIIGYICHTGYNGRDFDSERTTLIQAAYVLVVQWGEDRHCFLLSGCDTV